MADSPYHGDAARRVVNAALYTHKLGEALDNLTNLHRALTLEMVYPSQPPCNIGMRALNGRPLDTTSPHISTNITIDRKLLLSIVEMDIVRTLAALNESAQQIITATQSLPRIEVVDEQEKQT